MTWVDSTFWTSSSVFPCLPRPHWLQTVIRHHPRRPAWFCSIPKARRAISARKLSKHSMSMDSYASRRQKPCRFCACYAFSTRVSNTKGWVGSVLTHSAGDSAKSLKRSADYRAFERAMVDHARILVETGELVEPHVSIFFWGTILPDSLACAVSGQSPSFTEDDIRNFASFVDYSTEGIISMINEIEWGSP